MSDSDERNVVFVKKRIIGMTEEKHYEVSLTSKTDSVDDLIKKANDVLHEQS